MLRERVAKHVVGFWILLGRHCCHVMAQKDRVAGFGTLGSSLGKGTRGLLGICLHSYLYSWSHLSNMRILAFRERLRHPHDGLEGKKNPGRPLGKKKGEKPLATTDPNFPSLPLR